MSPSDQEHSPAGVTARGPLSEVRLRQGSPPHKPGGYRHGPLDRGGSDHVHAGRSDDGLPQAEGRRAEIRHPNHHLPEWHLPWSPLLHDKGGPTRMLPPTAGAVHTSGPAERELVTTSHTHYNLHHMMTFMM